MNGYTIYQSTKMTKLTKSLSNLSNLQYFSCLFILYLIAHGGILLIPNAIFWDDWVLYGVDSSIIYDTFAQTGSMFNLGGRTHVFLLSIGPWAYRVLTFLAFLLSGVLLDLILRRHPSIDTKTRFLVVLFFLVLPFNWARVTLICTPYAICHFFFFLAWFLMGKNRFLALVTFFISFNTNSFLVFYAVPFIGTYYQSLMGSRARWKSFFSFSLSHFDFVLLPFLYFAVKIIFYKPTGSYEGYNESYSLYNLILSPILMIHDWIKISVPLILLLVMTLAIWNIIFRSRLEVTKLKLAHSPYVFLLIGLIIFLCGAFPYWILGHVPTFVEWTSRHQLLLPLGFSIILLAFLALAENIYIRNLFLSILLSVCILMNIQTYRDFHVDWQKQSELIVEFSRSDVIKDSQLVFFDDKAKDLNALNRSYRFYEWNGLMAEAFGDERRFGSDVSELDDLRDGDFLERHAILFSGHYRAADFSPKNSNSVALVQIEPAYEGSFRQRVKNALLMRRSPLIRVSATYLGNDVNDLD